MTAYVIILVLRSAKSYQTGVLGEKYIQMGAVVVKIKGKKWGSHGSSLFQLHDLIHFKPVVTVRSAKCRFLREVFPHYDWIIIQAPSRIQFTALIIFVASSEVIPYLELPLVITSLRTHPNVTREHSPTKIEAYLKVKHLDAAVKFTFIRINFGCFHAFCCISVSKIYFFFFYVPSCCFVIHSNSQREQASELFGQELTF